MPCRFLSDLVRWRFPNGRGRVGRRPRLGAAGDSPATNASSRSISASRRPGRTGMNQSGRLESSIFRTSPQRAGGVPDWRRVEVRDPGRRTLQKRVRCRRRAVPSNQFRRSWTRSKTPAGRWFTIGLGCSSDELFDARRRETTGPGGASSSGPVHGDHVDARSFDWDRRPHCTVARPAGRRLRKGAPASIP